MIVFGVLLQEAFPNIPGQFYEHFSGAMLPGLVALLAGFGYRRFYRVTHLTAGLFFISLLVVTIGREEYAWAGLDWLGRITLTAFLLYTLSSFWIERKDDMDLRRRRSRFFLSGFTIAVLVLGVTLPPQHPTTTFSLIALWVVTLLSIQFANRPPKDVLIEDFDEKLEQFTHLFSKRGLYREDDLNLERIGDRLLLDNTKMRYLIHRGAGYRRLSDMLDEYRVAAAKAILSDIEQAQTPLPEVAIHVGYGSVEPLDAAFTRIVGVDPRLFRQARNRESDANRPLQLTNTDR